MSSQPYSDESSSSSSSSSSANNNTSTLSSSSSSSTLSNGQQTMLMILPIIPTILSIVGSSTIIYMVRRTRKQQKLRTYKRLLFGMSISDILCSWIVPFWTVLVPKETSSWIYAIGNDTTCTILGIFTQLIICAMLYNAMISFYFLLTIRFGIIEETITKYIEPIMHCFAICYPLTLIVASTSLNFYNEEKLGPGCWLGSIPKTCRNNNNEQEEQEEVVSETVCKIMKLMRPLTGLIKIIIFLTLLINNVIIYSFVRKTIRQSNRIILQQPSRTTTATTTIPNNSDVVINTETTTTNTNDITTVAETKDDNNNIRTTEEEEEEEETITTTMVTTIDDENQKRRIQLVATQAFLYVGGFFISYSWSLILRILASFLKFNQNDEYKIYPLLILQSIFYPLQGFFNFLIYIRPNYLRIKRSYPNESTVWVVRRIIFGEDQIRPSSTNNAATAMTISRFRDEINSS